MVKGSDLLVAALEHEGVDRVFGVPGEENLDVVESLRKSKITATYTAARNTATNTAAIVVTDTPAITQFMATSFRP